MAKATKKQSAWQEFSSADPAYLRSALNFHPVTALAAKAADAYAKYDSGDTAGAVFDFVPNGTAIQRAAQGDLVGAAASLAPKAVGKAYNVLTGKQDPTDIPVETRTPRLTKRGVREEQGGYGGNYGGNLSEYSGGGGGGWDDRAPMAAYKRGGKVKAYAKGGSSRGDGCAQRGHTKGRIV